MHILDGPRCSTSVRNDKGVSFLRVTTASMLPPVCHPSSLPCVTIAPPSKNRNVRSKIAHSPSPPPEKKVELFSPLTLTKYSLFFSLSLSLSLSLCARRAFAAARTIEFVVLYVQSSVATARSSLVCTRNWAPFFIRYNGTMCFTKYARSRTLNALLVCYG